MTQKPDWWPNNPYPANIFTMVPSQYPEIVPDPKLRTALSGMLGREFWDIASETIWMAMVENSKTTLEVVTEIAEMIESLPSGVDYDADPDDPSPVDATAHVGGLIWQICKRVLTYSMR